MAEPSFREARIFYNLTKDDFHAKLLDYRGSSLKRTVSDSAEDHSRMAKRVPVRGEEVNNAAQQALVEDRAAQCAQWCGAGYRPVKGRCEDHDTVMFWYCGDVGNSQAVMKALRRTCKTAGKHPAKCTTMSVYNYNGALVNLPYCADVIKIDERENEVDFTPTYEGYKTVPYEVWSPGTWDSFYELGGELGSLTANYDYRGHFSSGKSFQSQSPKQAHSWACLGCPSGILYVKTVGFKAEALGFSLPAGSWI